VAGDGLVALEFRLDGFGELFAEFHAPLVERVDVPDDALRENLVLVEGDERAERFRRERFVEERVRRFIAGEGFGRNQQIRRIAITGGDEFRAGFVSRFALHERLGLGEEVGDEDFVVAAERVVGLSRGKEVARDELRTLMDKLVEGVLAVRPRFPPDNGAGAVVNFLAALGNALAVAFHVALLEVSREAREILVIGQDGLRLCAEEVVVPDAEQPHDNRNVLLEGGGAEVLVNFMRASQQRLKVIHADGEGDGQADS